MYIILYIIGHVDGLSFFIPFRRPLTLSVRQTVIIREYICFLLIQTWGGISNYSATMRFHFSIQLSVTFNMLVPQLGHRYVYQYFKTIVNIDSEYFSFTWLTNCLTWNSRLELIHDIHNNRSRFISIYRLCIEFQREFNPNWLKFVRLLKICFELWI